MMVPNGTLNSGKSKQIEKGNSGKIRKNPYGDRG